jgi:hypothetical protein
LAFTSRPRRRRTTHLSAREIADQLYVSVNTVKTHQRHLYQKLGARGSCGSVEHCFFVSKRAGLIIWPAMGAVLFVVLGGITKSSLAVGWVPGVRDVLVPAVLFVVFGFQVGALVLAGRGSGVAAAAGGAGTRPERETRARSD